ncbi:MAG: tonB-system energizer ExbB [Paracoccus sp. (in: a-proteobacteria)]|uniref:tonB-system energizer ExbB n=1 Tax=Paracoccus sp. TaxID=267 RepID=UPI0026DFE54F|nr:tonB-system energizer ExbB [Paracoccus sp. (in: a-proteobacteria)]MDO5632760.1 tonB-system energizer ExbB [Paracoccus sp. (in: a-proteobacteria)]
MAGPFATTDRPTPRLPPKETDMKPTRIILPAFALLAVASTPVQAQIAIDSGLPHDLSPLGMYRQADIVVKSVMILLLAASVVTWTVLVVKAAEIFSANRRAGASLRRIIAAPSLDAAVATTKGSSDPASHMLRLAQYERDIAADATSAGLKDRVASQLDGVVGRAGRAAGIGTGVLATIGSTAPFVGLFGTVWGIMNSFIGIAEAQTTNLAVVAPGIAEALLATALGLVAAIPAVIVYNLFARAITGYRQRLNDAAQAVIRLVSRDLDRRGA